MHSPIHSIHTLATGEQSLEGLLAELATHLSRLYPEAAPVKGERGIIGRMTSMRSPSTDDQVTVDLERRPLSFLALNVWESRSRKTGKPIITLDDDQRRVIASVLQSSRYVAQLPPPASREHLGLDVALAGRRPYVYFYLKADALRQPSRATSDQVRTAAEELLRDFGRIERVLASDQVIEVYLADEAQFLKGCDERLREAGTHHE